MKTPEYQEEALARARGNLSMSKQREREITAEGVPVEVSHSLIRRLHYLVWCSEHGRVSVWASQQVAEPQRNWHELQHLEGVQGKQTVVRVQVIVE